MKKYHGARRKSSGKQSKSSGQQKTRSILKMLLGISDSVHRAGKLSDKDLASEVLGEVFGKFPIESYEQALVGELVDRFKSAKGLPPEK